MTNGEHLRRATGDIRDRVVVSIENKTDLWDKRKNEEKRKNSFWLLPLRTITVMLE